MFRYLLVDHTVPAMWRSLAAARFAPSGCKTNNSSPNSDIVAAREKAIRVIEKLRALRLTRAADLVEAAGEETLAYYAFPEEHWRRIRTNNPLERILREIRRRTRVVGAFPDGQSALNLAAARLRHIAGTSWSTKRYLNIELLRDQQMRGAITA